MSHQVRLDDDVYARIEAKKRDDETFSDAIDRLTAEWTLDDFAASDPVVAPETHRTLLDQTEDQSIVDTKAQLAKIGVEIEEEKREEE